jgi:hypothetical protein
MNIIRNKRTYTTKFVIASNTTSNITPDGTSKKLWSLILDAKTEKMTGSPVYYTTAYELHIAKTLCAFTAADGIILLSFTLNRLQAAGLGLIHSYIMGMILSYLVFGITCKKRNRRIIIALGCGMLGLLAVLDWRFETVLSCSALCSPWRLPFGVSAGTRRRPAGIMQPFWRMILIGHGLMLSLKTSVIMRSCFPRRWEP